ncbi:BMC domain-containing protein [Streptococcus marmotae]|uniref:BMC domain-containing protein n=1 Tax=Streptococcus marmotae TaxID=1825069 RepID=UPI0008342F6B|nr:BMC domain-containing protein [Streptococcus marmotae]
MKALGMIETYGLIGAIEAADVMLKVADVSLMNAEKVRGGLVTVYITGDVGAVKTAVDAGASAVKRLGELCFHSSHVIPRPDDQVVALYEKYEVPKESIGEVRASVEPEVKTEEANSEKTESLPPVITTVESEETALQSVPTILEIPEEADTEVIPEEMQPVEDEPEEVRLTAKEYKKRLDKTKAADLRELIHNHPELEIAEDVLQGMVRREMIAILMDEFEKQGER